MDRYGLKRVTCEGSRGSEVGIEIRLLRDERVGVMTVYPCLRESFHQSAAKLGASQPTMKLLLRPGDSTMSVEYDATDIREVDRHRPGESGQGAVGRAWDDHRHV